MTASDMGSGMYHVAHLFTLTFIQGHTDLNHENNKCSIISETVEAMPMAFSVKIVRSPAKGLHNLCQSHDLDLDLKSQKHMLISMTLTVTLKTFVRLVLLRLLFTSLCVQILQL